MEDSRMSPFRRIASIAFICTAAAASAFALTRAQSAPVAWLNQGWDAATRHRYYYESQGTRFIPAAILEALRTPSGQPLMAPANMRRLGFIVDEDRTDPANPYNWPVGFAIDRDQATGMAMAGFTCAACHTAQISYRGSTFRVDGGQAGVDINEFRTEMRQALLATAKDPARRAAFATETVKLGLKPAQLEASFAEFQRSAEADRMTPEFELRSTPTGPGRLDALNAIGSTVFGLDLDAPKNFKAGTAPVDFPYLWDITRFDWVQYNASLRQPMERNVGEALGVGVKTEFIDAHGKLNPEPLRWKSSVRIKSLYWMENAVSTLQPPVWNSAFGPIDRAKAARGRALFTTNCSMCHGVQVIEGTKPIEWHMTVLPIDRIGTDPNQATDFARNTFDATKLGLGKAVHANVGLGYVVTRVKHQAYRDAGIPQSQWTTYDGRLGNDFPAPCGYKARPLVGVWATAPFLHNGSVPTIYDLLSETRPSHFWFGSRELDPHKLGFAQTSGPGTALFDVSLTGNSNAGHWFTNDRTRRGRIGRALSDSEKYEIIEYLKAATYADYPMRAVGRPGPLPCQNDPNWAMHIQQQTK
jgi:mono/diheme cytochrome c family protein